MAPVDRAAAHRRLATIARLLDTRVRLPGGIRIGLDGLLGLIPGFGDGAAALVALYVVAEGARLGASPGLVARMVFNVVIDTAVGVIPLAGDVFDIWFKSTTRNLALLERAGVFERPVD